MKQGSPKKSKLVKGAVIFGAAAILTFAAYKVGRSKNVSVESLKATAKDAVKDIKVPEPISAVDVKKLLADQKRIVRKGRRISKKIYKDIEKRAAEQIGKAQKVAE